ncbi:hypothetical protein ACFQ9X_23555 [Catenulispora yoronensis]
MPVGGRPGADAGTTVAIGDRETLAEYLDKNWRRYRGDEASPVVVEHYILDCGRLHIEFLAAPEGVSVLFTATPRPPRRATPWSSRRARSWCRTSPTSSARPPR